MRTWILCVVALALAAGLADSGRVWAGSKPPRQWNQYERAIMECRSYYFGQRSPSTSATRPMMIESCFYQKTGKFPAQVGIPIYAAPLPRIVR
jgi:hypothetical protein